MTDSQDATFKPAEYETYFHLGVIAANAGYGAMIYRMRKDIDSGESNPAPGDLMPYFAKQAFSDEDLDELYSFRNKLLHGVVIIKPDGAVQIGDGKKQDILTYTAEEIREYAGRFYYLRFENRVDTVTVTDYAYAACFCGVEFQLPEFWEDYQIHKRHCPAYALRKPHGI